MNKRTALSLAAGMSLVCAGPAPASVKPCRDRAGKVIQCPKIRKPSPRCKDSSGRFIACAPIGDPAGKISPSATP